MKYLSIGRWEQRNRITKFIALLSMTSILSLAVHNTRAELQPTTGLWSPGYRQSFPEVTITDGSLFIEATKRRMNENSDWSAAAAAAMYHAQILHYQELRGGLSALTEADRKDIAQKVNLAVDQYRDLRKQAVSRDGYQSRLPSEEANLILEAIEMIPGGEKVKKLGGFLISGATYAEKKLTAADRQTDSQIELAKDSQELQERAGEYLGAMRETLKSDPALAERMNAAFDGMFGIPIFAPDQTYYDRDPNLVESRALIFIADRVLEIQKEQKATSAALNRLREEIEQSRRTIVSKLERIGSNIDALDSEVREIEKRRDRKELSVEAARTQLEAIQKRKADLYTEKMDQYAALALGGQILGSVGALIPDPALARKIQQVSGVMAAAATIGQSLTKFQFGQYGKLGGAAMTGDILGATVLLVGLFSNQKSPEAIILEQLENIRKEIDSFRQQMHGRFDRVDALLNESLRISGLIFQEIQRGNSEIQKTLDLLMKTQDARLTGLERKLEDSVFEILTQNATSAEFKCGKWQRERLRTPMTPQKFEDECIYPLIFLGEVQSLQPGLSMGENRLMGPENWEMELAKPLSKNLEYVRKVIETQLKVALPGLRSPIPNAAALITGASSSSNLVREFPELSKQQLKPELFQGLRDLIENGLQKFAAVLHDRPEVFAALGTLSDQVYAELKAKVEIHHSVWKIHQGLDSQDGSKRTPIYGDVSEDPRKILPNGFKVAESTYLPNEFRSCDPNKTHGINLPIPEIYNSVPSQSDKTDALKGPRLVRYALQLGIGPITSCYENLELIEVAKECQDSKKLPLNNRYCAALRLDQVVRLAGVEVLRFKHKTNQHYNSLAHSSTIGPGAIEVALKQLQETRMTVLGDPAANSVARNMLRPGLLSIYVAANTVSNPPLEMLIQKRVEDLQVAYQEALVQALLNPIPSGNADFEVIRRKLAGITSLADAIVQIAYPRSIIAYQDVSGFVFGDLTLEEWGENALKRMYLYESFANYNNLIERISQNIQKRHMDLTPLPPYLSTRAVMRYQSLLTRQPNPERYPILDTLLSDLKIAEAVLE